MLDLSDNIKSTRCKDRVSSLGNYSSLTAEGGNANMNVAVSILQLANGL